MSITSNVLQQDLLKEDTESSLASQASALVSKVKSVVKK